MMEWDTWETLVDHIDKIQCARIDQCKEREFLRRTVYWREICDNQDYYVKHAKELIKVYEWTYIAIHNQQVIQVSDFPLDGVYGESLIEPRAYVTFVGDDFMTKLVRGWLKKENWHK
jgi:hypothetical protein